MPKRQLMQKVWVYCRERQFPVPPMRARQHRANPEAGLSYGDGNKPHAVQTLWKMKYSYYGLGTSGRQTPGEKSLYSCFPHLAGRCWLYRTVLYLDHECCDELEDADRVLASTRTNTCSVLPAACRTIVLVRNQPNLNRLDCVSCCQQHFTAP